MMGAVCLKTLPPRSSTKWLWVATSANVIGEIPGRERPDEIVLIGGHLDSWDVGQGAQDDGSGVIASLEAAAIIKNMLPETRIVLFTLNGDLAIKGSSKTNGVDLIVSKAEGATGLTNAIQTLLAEPEKSLRPIAP